MNKRLIKYVSVLMGVVMILVSIPIVSVNAIDTSNSAEEALREKISSYKSEQETLKAKLDAAESDLKDTENKKEILDGLIRSTGSEIDAATELLSEYNVKIEEKNAEIETQQKEIDDKYDEMMQRLRFSYEGGDASYLELLFSSAKIEDFLSNMENVNTLLEYDESLMKELSGKLKTLNDEKTVLSNTKNEQEIIQNDLKEKQADYEEQQKAAKEYISQLYSTKESLDEAYEKSVAAEKQADAEIAAILKERQKIAEQEAAKKGTRAPSPKAGSAKFIWPCPSSCSRISSGYGWRVIFGRSDFHLGIDIPGASGTSIYASRAGTVVTATYHYSYGYYVLIDHGDGFATLYAHNSQLLVSAGDEVSQGQCISKMGTTGSSTGNHLHFEVRYGGNTQNPEDYVSP